jgi:hypothetical protein
MGNAALGFRGFETNSKRQHGIHFCNFEQIHDAAVGAGDDKLCAVRLAANIVVHHKTHAGGIHVRNIAQIDDRESRQFGATEFTLQLEEIAQSQRTAQAEDTGAGVLAFTTIDSQGAIVQHSEIKCMEREALDDYSSVNVAQATGESPIKLERELEGSKEGANLAGR